MDETLKIAYAEVNQILDVLGNSYKQKIPNKIIKLFKEKQDNSHKLKLDKNTKIEDVKLNRITLIIISILNLKYWVNNEDEKNKLKEKYKKNEEEYTEKISIYKEQDWLSSRKNKEKIKENNVETGLIKIKNDSIFDKIKGFFRKLFNIGK